MAKLNILPENPEKDEPLLGRFPKWLHRSFAPSSTLWQTAEILDKKRLPTVCEEARCPNLLECWSKKTATFLALGKQCTRSCGFCSIDFSKTPPPPQKDEPERIADSVFTLGLRHAVITMVARDDLPDGGAGQIAAIISSVREKNPHVTIEVLTSDFAGNKEALSTVLEAKPEIFNHNIETVASLTPKVRHKATYERTLSLLREARQFGAGIKIKSGFMVGLGESDEEVQKTIEDLYHAGCDIITIGHYLQSSVYKLRVKAFIPPEKFAEYAEYGHRLGVKYVFAAPFVRSSYNAAEVFEKAI